MAGYQQFLDTVGNFFERAGTELHKKGKQYDSEGSPSFLLIDKQRKSLYLMEIGHTGKNIEIDNETLEMVETFAKENDKSEEIVRLIVALARAIIIADQHKINHPDIDDLQQRSALVVEDALSEELNNFLDSLRIEYRKVPFKGAFTIFFFNVDNSVLLGDFYYDFLDEAEATFMNRSIGQAEAIQLAKEQKEAREKVELSTTSTDGSINRFDHITDPDSIYLDGITSSKTTQETYESTATEADIKELKTDEESEREKLAKIKQKAKDKFSEATSVAKGGPTAAEALVAASAFKGKGMTESAAKSTINDDTKRYTRPTTQGISKEKLSDFASKANKSAIFDASSSDILHKINTREFRDEQRAKKESRSKAQAQKEATLKTDVTNEGRLTRPTTALEQKMALRKQMVNTELLRKESKEKFEALKRQREQEKQETLLHQQQFMEESTVFHEDEEIYPAMANLCTHFTEAITFLPVYILKRLTKSKMPDGILYWIGAMVTLIGVYFIPLSKVGGALTNRMSGTAANIMTSANNLFTSWRVDALMTDMPPAIASMLSTFISSIYFLYSVVTSGMHYVSGSFHLRFLLAFAFAIAAVSAFRKFGRGLISFILLTFLFYYPIMATSNFAIKRILKAAPDYMTVFIAAEAGYTSTLLIIMPTIAGILFATILVPIAVVTLAIKGSNRGEELVFPQPDDDD